jgi:hypothetical protein
VKILMDAHLLRSRETGNETYRRNLINGLWDLPIVNIIAAILKGNVIPENNAERVLSMFTTMA